MTHDDHELIARLIEHSPTGPDFDPARQTLTLLAALGELSGTLDAPGAGRWFLASYDLRTILTVAAGLASCFDIQPHQGAAWPDGVQVGGDGASVAVHPPHHLLAELVVAAGWVAEWVRDTAGEDTAWQSAVPLTELIARTWCLAGRLGVRDGLRALIEEQLPVG